MLSTILLTLDGSPLAERALPLGVHLASVSSARLVLVRVIEEVDAELEPTEAEAVAVQEAEAYLARMAETLRRTGLQVATAIAYDDAPNAILEQARLTAAGIIVMATHGRPGATRWWYGSVADEVLRRSPVPVAIVPTGWNGSWPTDRKPRILVPLDESEVSEAALAPTLEVARELGAELILTEVVPWPPAMLYAEALPPEMFDVTEQFADAQAYLDAVVRQIESSAVAVTTRVQQGSPQATLTRIAEEEQVDLIAMATHGRTGLGRLVLGSVATDALQHATVPVLLIRPPALASHQVAEPSSMPATVTSQ